MSRRKAIKLDLGAEVEDMVRDNTVATPAPIPPAKEEPMARAAEPEQAPSAEPVSKPAKTPKPNPPKPEQAPVRVSVEVPFTDDAIVAEIQRTAKRSGVPVSRVLGVYVREAKERLIAAVEAKGSIRGPHVSRDRVIISFKTTLTFDEPALERIHGDLDPDRIMTKSLTLARALAAQIKSRK